MGMYSLTPSLFLGPLIVFLLLFLSFRGEWALFLTRVLGFS